MTRLQTAAARLATRLQSRAGEELVFRRPGFADIALTGIKSRIDYRQQEMEGQNTGLASWEFVVQSADLTTTDGLKLKPQRGDLFLADLDGVQTSFPVTSPDGEHYYRAVDHDQIQIRIRALQMGPVGP